MEDDPVIDFWLIGDLTHLKRGVIFFRDVLFLGPASPKCRNWIATVLVKHFELYFEFILIILFTYIINYVIKISI